MTDDIASARAKREEREEREHRQLVDDLIAGRKEVVCALCGRVSTMLDAVTAHDRRDCERTQAILRLLATGEPQTYEGGQVSRRPDGTIYVLEMGGVEKAEVRVTFSDSDAAPVDGTIGALGDPITWTVE